MKLIHFTLWSLKSVISNTIHNVALATVPGVYAYLTKNNDIVCLLVACACWVLALMALLVVGTEQQLALVFKGMILWLIANAVITPLTIAVLDSWKYFTDNVWKENESNSSRQER